MVPKILHQTWKNKTVPRIFKKRAASWKALHRDWKFKLWTDADIADLVQTRYPEYWDLFQAYPSAIMRADLGRYLILREFGGVYADLGVRPVARFEPLLDTQQPVFAYEPQSHAQLEFVQSRGFSNIVSNAVILSPPKHPFWDHLLGLIKRCSAAVNPLDATGPFVLTAACELAGDMVRILPAHVFSPADKDGLPVAQGTSTVPVFADRQWAGTWCRPLSLSRNSIQTWRKAAFHILAWLWPRYRRQLEINQKEKVAREALIRLAFENAELEAKKFRDKIDLSRLKPIPQKGRHVLIAIPARDAAATFDRLMSCVLALSYPRVDLTVAFLEGDSRDDTLQRIQSFAKAYASDFRKVDIIKDDSQVSVFEPRWAPELQLIRRSHIASVRNKLIEKELDDIDWVLWIDADIIFFPSDTLTRLLACEARIAHPNTLRLAGGKSMDQNAWTLERQLSPEQMAPYIIDGLYQPPEGFQRLYLSDLRYRDKVVLDSVGGTMLLADAGLHRAGLIFPKQPYRFLIETEAFGAAARDLGIAPVGLPNVEIIHDAR